jgi:hypothetical protein
MGNVSMGLMMDWLVTLNKPDFYLNTFVSWAMFLWG